MIDAKEMFYTELLPTHFLATNPVLTVKNAP